MSFLFNTKTKIYFDHRAGKELPSIISQYGTTALLITGKQSKRYQTVIDAVLGAGINLRFASVAEEPSLETVDSICETHSDIKIDVVIGLGGGSVIDTAKAVCAMLSNSGHVLDYLEVIGKGKPLSKRPLPCIAVPTTAGTGSEVTKNSVLYSDKHRIKVSLRNESMTPEVALVDPELTLSVPQSITAHTGMDAFTQVIEPFVSCMSTPFTDALCRDAILHAGPAISAVFRNPEDINSRRTMSYVSLIGGIALANAKLGAVHGFAGVIGGLCKAPHGAVCAALLPSVLEVNSAAVEDRGSREQKSKYLDLAKLVTGNSLAGPEEAVNYIKDLKKKLSVEGLASLGIDPSFHKEIIDKSKNASSMRGNTLPLTDEELMLILEKAME